MANNMSDAIEALLQKVIATLMQFAGTCTTAAKTIEANKSGSGSALSASEQAQKNKAADAYKLDSQVCRDAAVKAGNELGLGSDRDSTPTHQS